MRRAPLLLGVSIVAALLLSACKITFEPLPPPTPTIEVTVGNDFRNPARTISLRSGESVLVGITYETNLPLLYVELGHGSAQNLALEVYTAGYNRLASSSSPTFFASGTGGLATADLEPTQVVEEDIACRGSCVIIERGDHTVLLARITNRGSATVDVDLFAYGDDYQDAGEPNNDSLAGATVYPVGTSAAGAIETLGDRDFWAVQGNGWVEFVAVNAALDLTLELYTADGTLLGIHENLDTFQVVTGNYLVVSARGSRAAPSADSTYSLVDGSL